MEEEISIETITNQYFQEADEGRKNLLLEEIYLRRERATKESIQEDIEIVLQHKVRVDILFK